MKKWIYDCNYIEVLWLQVELLIQVSDVIPLWETVCHKYLQWSVYKVLTMRLFIFG